MRLGWANRLYIAILAAMILGACAILPGYWLSWPDPVRKATVIGTGWVVLGLLLPWAEKAHDRPHTILLVRNRPLSRGALTIFEFALVGAFLWILLY